MGRRINTEIKDGWFAAQTTLRDRMIRIAFTRTPPGAEQYSINDGRSGDFVFLTILWPRAIVCTSDAKRGGAQPVGQTFAGMLIEPFRLIGVDAEYVHERLGRPMDESRAIASLLTRLACDERFLDWWEQLKCQS